MSRMMSAQKEAAGRAATAATINGQQQSYQHGALLSRPKTDTADALGALLLYIMSRSLPNEEQRLGWALVERWTAQLVEARA